MKLLLRALLLSAVLSTPVLAVDYFTEDYSSTTITSYTYEPTAARGLVGDADTLDGLHSTAFASSTTTASQFSSVAAATTTLDSAKLDKSSATAFASSTTTASQFNNVAVATGTLDSTKLDKSSATATYQSILVAKSSSTAYHTWVDSATYCLNGSAFNFNQPIDVGTNTITAAAFNSSASTTTPSLWIMGDIVISTSAGGHVLINGSAISTSPAADLASGFSMLSSTPTSVTLSTGSFAVTSLSTSSYILWANCNGIFNGIHFSNDLINVTTGVDSGGTFVDSVSTMTSATTDVLSTGGVASSSGYFVYPEYLAFNKVLGDSTAGWYSYQSLPIWLRYDFTSPHTIRKYIIVSEAGGYGPPTAWTFEGWNGASWDTLDTQSGITTWTGDAVKDFSIAAPAAYSGYRVYITAGGDGATPNSLLIAELYLLEY
jgi:hypothetical protein